MQVAQYLKVISCSLILLLSLLRDKESKNGARENRICLREGWSSGGEPEREIGGAGKQDNLAAGINLFIDFFLL